MVRRKSQFQSRAKKGQELLELAITLPVFLLMVFGIFDVGRGVYIYSAMQNSAREGARYGIVNPWDSAGVITAAKSKTIGVDPSAVNVTVNWGCATLVVTEEYDFSTVTPVIGTVTLQTQSTMQRERWLLDIGEPDYGCLP